MYPLTKTQAEMVLMMLGEWNENFKSENEGYYNGYIDATLDLLRVLHVSLKDLRDITKGDK